MRILGIETSCDETAAAVVEDGRKVLSTVIATSKHAFRSLAGVIPEEAARKQVECMLPVLQQALHEAQASFDSTDAIAVTRGPGLLGSLLVGTTTARVLSSVHSLPLIGVHHTLGHLTSTWLEAEDEPHFPLLALSVSGGHTDLWYRESHTRGRLLGRTRDDAAGEAFDKGASLLGLPYPGGPAIALAAAQGDPHAFPFPLPLHGDATLDFSFSGLKTALRYSLQDLGVLREGKGAPPRMDAAIFADIAASYQHAISLHLADRVRRALDLHPALREVHLVGGVSANLHLRALLTELLAGRKDGPLLRWPKMLPYCTDNAAMIAAAGFFLAQERGENASLPFTTEASLALENV